MVRISLGAYNTADDVDVLIDMLGRISRREYEGQYRCADDTGEYRLAGDDDAVGRFTKTLFPRHADWPDAGEVAQRRGEEIA